VIFQSENTIADDRRLNQTLYQFKVEKYMEKLAPGFSDWAGANGWRAEMLRNARSADSQLWEERFYRLAKKGLDLFARYYQHNGLADLFVMEAFVFNDMDAEKAAQWMKDHRDAKHIKALGLGGVVNHSFQKMKNKLGNV